jgi:hypothetical protein
MRFSSLLGMTCALLLALVFTFSCADPATVQIFTTPGASEYFGSLFNGEKGQALEMDYSRQLVTPKLVLDLFLDQWDGSKWNILAHSSSENIVGSVRFSLLLLRQDITDGECK